MKRTNLVIFALCIFTLLIAPTAFGQQINLVSVNNTGLGGGNDTSLSPSISADGRYVAFGSRATNLVPNDNNGKYDGFVRDTVAGTTILLNTSSAGEVGNNDSGGAVLSANGQLVAFMSKASNIVSNDNNNYQDVFVKNLVTGATSLVSFNSGGTGSANSASSNPQISADGRYVAFMSIASDIVPNDTNGYAADIFVRDMQAGTTQLVSANAYGGSGNRDTFRFILSANGRHVAFDSNASDLVVRDTNNLQDVFVRDLDAGTTSMVSVNRLGTRSGNGSSVFSSISGDGRYLLFISTANNLTGNDVNLVGDLFVRDTLTRTTTLLSVNRDGLSHSGVNGILWATISQNGSKALFAAWDSDMVEADENFRLDYFVRDLSAGTTQILSSKNIRRTGTSLDEFTYFTAPGISADGRYVMFCINRHDVTARKNVYVRDLMTDSLTWVNPTTDYWGAERPVMSSDGQSIAFESFSSNLVPSGTTNYGNVFVFRENSLMK